MNPQNLVNTTFQNWLDVHPTIAWFTAHPLSTLGLVALMFFLFWGLLNAIARFTERFWLALLRSPIALVQWLFRGSPKILQRWVGKKSCPDSQQQLTLLLERLAELRQEEAQLLEQVRTLVSARKLPDRN